jgi:hypothetical protein
MQRIRTFLALVRQIKYSIIAAVFLERHEIRPNRFAQPFELYAVWAGEYRVCAHRPTGNTTDRSVHARARKTVATTDHRYATVRPPWLCAWNVRAAYLPRNTTGLHELQRTSSSTRRPAAWTEVTPCKRSRIFLIKSLSYDDDFPKFVCGKLADTS